MVVKSRKCGFCDNTSENSLIIEGKTPRNLICDKCIAIANDLIKCKNNSDFIISDIPTPEQIVLKLNENIIGQYKAKKVLSVAVYQHYQRIINKKKIQKSNVLMIGPSGSGKTLMVSEICKLLKVPYSIGDATTLTESGYVGDDVENLLLRLYQNSNMNKNATEIGVIYIDEIDKIARKSGKNPSITRDVSGEGVQQGLLKMLEGTISDVHMKGERKHPRESSIQINTNDILFICSGAFIGLDLIISTRLNKKTIGFSLSELNSEKIINDVIAEDLIEYGILPELVGRLPIVTILNQLKKEELLKILTEPRDNIINQVKSYFEMENCEIFFNEDALECIVDKSIKQKTGARGLRSIIEDALLETYYILPNMRNKKFIVTKELIEKKIDIATTI